MEDTDLTLRQVSIQRPRVFALPADFKQYFRYIMSYPIQFEHAEQHYLYVTPNTFDMGTQQPVGLRFMLKIGVYKRSSLLSSEFKIHGHRVTSTPNSITFDRMTGTIQSGEETCLQVEFTVNFPGRHRDKIIIRNIHDPRDVETIWISSCGIRPLYVRLPELDPARTGKLQTLLLYRLGG